MSDIHKTDQTTRDGAPSSQDLDEQRLHRLANRRHRNRANVQLLIIAVVVGAVIFAPDMRVRFSAIVDDSDSLARDLLRVLAVFGPIAVAGALHLGLSLMIVILRYDWRQAISQAHSSDRPEKCAEGFMRILADYNLIRVRALYGALFSISIIYIGAMSLIDQVRAPDMSILIVVLGGAEIVAGGALYVRSRLVERLFLPGRAIVGQTLELAIRAASSNESITRAQAAADRLEADIIQKAPWWYFPTDEEH